MLIGNPNTGEIIAMASCNGIYDLNNPRKLDKYYKKEEGEIKEDLNNITTPEQSKDILNAITENRTMQIENLTGQIQASQSQYEQVLDFIQNGDYSQYANDRG